MSVVVCIPTQLRLLTEGASEVEVSGGTVGEILKNLDRDHSGFSERLLDEEGRLRRFVNVYLDDEDIRFLDGLSTPVPNEARLAIIPAVAGG